MKELGLKAAALVLASFMAGLAVAGASGYGPLAYISYTISGNGGGSNGTIITVPVSFDLGQLEVGQAGNFSGSAEVTVSDSGYYKIELEHESHLKKVFAKFDVTVEIGNNTVVLSLYGQDEAYIYLEAGTYNATVTVDYVVKSNPASQTANNMLFLKIESEYSGPS